MQYEEDIHQINEIFNVCCLALIITIKIFPKLLKLLISKRGSKKSLAPKRKKSINEIEYSNVSIEFESVL